MIFNKQILGSSLSSPVYERRDKGNTFYIGNAFRKAKYEIRRRNARARWNSPHTPLPLKCPLADSVVVLV